MKMKQIIEDSGFIKTINNKTKTKYLTLKKRVAVVKSFVMAGGTVVIVFILIVLSMFSR